MKSIKLIVCAIILSSVQLVYSQVVINKVDFPLLNGYVSDWNTAYPEEITMHATGENQTWDISNLQIEEQYSTEYFDANNDEYYTEANYYVNFNYILDQFIINSIDFYKVDDNGYTKEGRRIEEVTYPITQLTGGPNDNLKIIGGNSPFIGRGDLIQFPAELNKSWTQSFIIPTNFELTVEAFGLNGTPGLFMQTHNQTRTVVGSGKLTLPNKNGGVMTIDALLIRYNGTSIDSVFLGGQPAPPTLMSAFNLEQGASVSVEQYVFYSPGYGFSIAAYDLTEKYITYQSISGPTSSVESNALNQLSVYPNPVKSGSILNIIDSKVNLSNLVLVDQTGKVVLENQMMGNTNLSIPSTITAGAYLLNSYDSKGTIISTNKIIIE